MIPIMAMFLEKKTQYVRVTDTSGNPLLSEPSNGSLKVTVTNPAGITEFGEHGNAWNEAEVPDVSHSSHLYCNFCNNIAIFGSVSGVGGNPSLELQVSQDASAFYKTGSIITLVANSDFYAEAQVPARYVRLLSHTTDASLTYLTATIAGKS